MAENKKSFIAYTDWKDTFDALPDDKAGILIKFIYAYVNDENPKTDDVLINAVFANIKNTLKRDLKKWEKQYNQRVKAGKRSAEVRKQNATSVNERSNSSTVSVNVSVNDNSITYYIEESEFLKDWKKVRENKTNQTTNINKLTQYELNDFNQLKKEFTKQQFQDAMLGLFEQKNMFPANKLRPTHFLRDRNIEKYLDCKTNNKQLFEEKQMKL